MAAVIARVLREKFTSGITSQIRSKSTSVHAQMKSFFGELTNGKTKTVLPEVETKAARKATLKQTVSDIGLLGIPIWFSLLLSAHVLTKPMLVTAAADPGECRAVSGEPYAFTEHRG